MINNKNILIISTVGLIYDGITSVIISYLQAMDLSGLKIYVAATIDSKPNLRKQIEELGCTVVDFSNRRTHTLKYAVELSMYIRRKKIDVIHVHGNSGTMAIEMIASYLGGCKRRIAHSHNTRCDQVKADKMLRPLFYRFFTKAIACGTEAGNWLFPNRDFEVLKNGRNIDYFSFSQEKQSAFRKKLSIDGSIAIGHVGGFYPQKNHDFLVEIYREIRKMEPDAKLYMIGDGPLKSEIEQKASNIGVVFTGTTDSISDYLNAMDGMLLPSLFEGVPLVVIEWQINGIPCLLSDKISKECALTENVEFLSLSELPENWAKKIINMAKNNNRELSAKIAIDKVMACGFDIIESAKRLKQIYTG